MVVLDPGDDSYSTAFNPLACGIADPSEAASLVLEAVLKAWGADSFNETPRMEGLLRGVFRLLAANELTRVTSANSAAVQRATDLATLNLAWTTTTIPATSSQRWLMARRLPAPGSVCRPTSGPVRTSVTTAGISDQATGFSKSATHAPAEA